MSAVTIAKDIEKGLSIAGLVAKDASTVLPWISLVAGFFPGAAAVIAALQIAGPIIQKIAAVAPMAASAIEAGIPVAQAIDNASPSMLADIKKVYAAFAMADPSVDAVEADSVTDEQALAFAGPMLFGRPWTDAETQRWFDKADGTTRDGLGNPLTGW